MICPKLPLFLSFMCFLQHLRGPYPTLHNFCRWSIRRCHEAVKQHFLQPDQQTAATRTATVWKPDALPHPTSLSDVKTMARVKILGWGQPVLKNFKLWIHLWASSTGCLMLLLLKSHLGSGAFAYASSYSKYMSYSGESSWNGEYSWNYFQS